MASNHLLSRKLKEDQIDLVAERSLKIFLVTDHHLIFNMQLVSCAIHCNSPKSVGIKEKLTLCIFSNFIKVNIK